MYFFIPCPPSVLLLAAGEVYSGSFTLKIPPDRALEQFSLFVSELFAWFFYSSGADKPAYSNRGNDYEKLGKTSEALAVAAPLAVLNGKAFAPTRGRWGIRMYARLLVSAGLALWLLPDTVGAQQQSVDLCKGQ